MRFGVSIWPFQWSPPYDDAIRRVARLGFSRLELIAWNRQAFDEYYTPAQITSLRSLIADLGLEVSEFVSSPPNISSADPSQRAAAVDHFRRLVDTALAFDTRLVNSVVAAPFSMDVPRLLDLPTMQEVALPVSADLDWKGNYEAYVDTLRECCAICETSGVRYALEPHPYRWAPTAQALLRLTEHVGSPSLGVNVDPSHLFPCGEIPNMVVYQLGDRVFHVHVSDNDSYTNAHWRPGKGKIDWKAFLKSLQDVGFDGTISIELEGITGASHRGRPTADESIDQEYLESRAYLSRLGEELGLKID